MALYASNSLTVKCYSKWTQIHTFLVRTHNIRELTKHIFQKGNTSRGFLKRNLKYCSEDCKILAYISLVRPILENGVVFWDPYQDIIAVEKEQFI